MANQIINHFSPNIHRKIKIKEMKVNKSMHQMQINMKLMRLMRIKIKQAVLVGLS